MLRRFALFKQEKKLKCVVCDKEIDLPKCCKEYMEIKGDYLTCKYCGDKNEVPIHCGKQMT